LLQHVLIRRVLTIAAASLVRWTQPGVAVLLGCATRQSSMLQQPCLRSPAFWWSWGL